jgi:predicted molibdopterin-dependent oxidoreductase YjgC
VLALRMKKAVRNGATLVVADPRKIWLTKLARRHLQLRPGSDVWLVNALMHVILREGLQNDEYIAEHTEDFDAVRDVVARYTPEEAEKATGVPAEDIVATAREYATERYAAIFYTLGITEHACAVDNIWSLSNLVLMTGHLGYESTGLNALRGQNNVQGLNDAGANPAYLPGYQPVDDPEIWRKFSEAWGVDVPTTPGYRLDQMMSGLHDGRIRALYLVGENPAQTEPNAHHVEEGLAGLDFVVAQDLFLNDSSAKYADVVLPASSFAEKDGTFTNTERRVNRVRKAVPCPGNAREDLRIVVDMAEALGADWPDYESAEDAWNEFSPPSGRASATTGSRRSASSGRARIASTPAPRTCTRRIPRGRAGRASSIPSSTSRRSSSPIPSFRSSSRPGGRSTTTTRPR